MPEVTEENRTENFSVGSQAQATLLVIDDEPDIRESLQALLSLEGYAVDTAASAAEGLRRLESASYDLVLLDLMLPDRPGMEVLAEIRQQDPDVPVFVITAYGSVEIAVEALKAGANDYFAKPWDNEKLLVEIKQAITRRRLELENVQLKRALKQRYSFPNIVGKSEAIQRVLDIVSQVAPTRSTVLITGETGTGKELIAKAIHAASPRANNVFIPVNSGSLPGELLESILFGHVKGAFTGAVSSHKGYFEIAHGGTIFFDEIGTLSLETQAKLLRVLQEKEFIPLGATRPVRVDVRVIAATNANLQRLVREGKFREDLYYRLNVIHIHLPPLRERKEDIPLLVEHFVEKYCRETRKFLDDKGKPNVQVDPEVMKLFMDYDWPGNVRELENAIERAIVLAPTPVITVDLLPDTIVEATGSRLRLFPAGQLPPDASLFEIVADFERRVILEHLQAANWSQTEAAEALRIPLSTLNQKIKRLNIVIPKRSEVARNR